MKLAIQRCCTTSEFLKQYETSTDALLRKLGVELIDIKGFNCCGYPLRNIDSKAHILASARNLALALKEGLDILTICNCCYGNLKKAKHLLEQNDSLREEINSILKKEDISINEFNIKVKHLLELLYYDIGREKLSNALDRRFNGLNVAIHYGCHLLRPRKVIDFDDPFNPKIFEELVEITGANIILWNLRLDCCGSPVMGIDSALGSELTKKKIRSAKESGADVICVACPYCHIQFDRIQKEFIKGNGKFSVPAILFTQFLGLVLGIDEKTLGLRENFIDITYIKNLLLPTPSPIVA